MTTAVAPQNGNIAAYEAALVQGDLEKLSTEERIAYYRNLCNSLGLNHLTQPFGYLKLSGKLTLYAKKDATDQLRHKQKVSIVRLERETVGDLYVVTAYARTPDGREDSDMGAVSISGKRGDDLVNAMLKAVTKAKRRVTLSICGLGWLDETETETIPGATIEHLHDEYQAGTPTVAVGVDEGGPAVPMITLAQQKAIRMAGEQRGLTKDEMVARSQGRFGVGVKDLTYEQGAALLAEIQTIPMTADEEPEEDDEL